MGWFGSNKSYKSTNHTKFAVGEIVEYASSDIFKIHTDYLKAEITDVQTEKSGWFNKEFVYTIKLDKNDKIIKNVYESELERYYDGVKHYYPDLHNTETDHLVFAIPREGVDFSLYSDNILEITYNAETKKYSMWVDIDYPRYFYFYEKLAPFMYNLCASPKEVNEKWEKIALPITMAGPDYLEGDIWTSNSLWVLYGNLLKIANIAII